MGLYILVVGLSLLIWAEVSDGDEMEAFGFCLTLAGIFVTCLEG